MKVPKNARYQNCTNGSAKSKWQLDLKKEISLNDILTTGPNSIKFQKPSSLIMPSTKIAQMVPLRQTKWQHEQKNRIVFK